MQSFKQPLSKDDENIYLAKSKEGDIEARNILVEYNLRLVAHIVKKYQSPSRSTEDLISIGTIGLIKAINSYSKDKGSRLVTYASRCIENEILMRLRQERKENREISLFDPIGTDKEGNEISLMDIISNGEDEIISDYLLNENIDKMLILFDEILSPREKDILNMRYGLNYFS